MCNNGAEMEHSAIQTYKADCDSFTFLAVLCGQSISKLTVTGGSNTINDSHAEEVKLQAFLLGITFC